MGAATDRTADQEEKELRDAFRVTKEHNKVWYTKYIHHVDLNTGGSTYIFYYITLKIKFFCVSTVFYS
jgi:hypothetical protein